MGKKIIIFGIIRSVSLLPATSALSILTVSSSYRSMKSQDPFHQRPSAGYLFSKCAVNLFRKLAHACKDCLGHHNLRFSPLFRDKTTPLTISKSMSSTFRKNVGLCVCVCSREREGEGRGRVT